MKLRIVALGHKLPAWADEAYADYARRMPRGLEPELVVLKAEPRDRGKSVEQVLAAEAERIADATKGYYVVALDERGRSWTTAELAAALGKWRDSARDVAFVIGSADGLATKRQERGGRRRGAFRVNIAARPRPGDARRAALPGGKPAARPSLPS